MMEVIGNIPWLMIGFIVAGTLGIKGLAETSETYLGKWAARALLLPMQLGLVASIIWVNSWAWTFMIEHWRNG